MLMYEYDSKKILDEPIKNRQAETIHNVSLKIHKVLKARIGKPKVYIMDNKCSSDLKEAMKKYEIDFQLAPPYMHRKMNLNKQSELTKTTSYLDSQKQIHISQSANGTGYSLNA